MLRGYFVTVLLGRLRYKGLGNCRSDIRGSDCLGQFEGGDGRQGTASDRLQVTVHTLGAADDLANLLFLAGPLRLEPALLPLDIIQEIGESLDDRLHAVLELGADQVAVQDLHLLVLAGLVGAFGIDRDQDVAQQGSEVACVAALDDPHAVAVDEGLDAGRRIGRDQHGNVRLGLALIIAQFGEPGFLPFAVLGLPQDRPAIAATAVDDLLGDVGAALTLFDGNYTVDCSQVVSEDAPTGRRGAGAL